MSNESYVSNGGVVVSVYDEGLSGTGEGPMGIEIGSALDVALATHYQQRRDKVLRIWRNPDKPNEVVYPLDDGEVRVLDERDGASIYLLDREDAGGSQHMLAATARAYFAAHPPEPKPWHEAKAGEVWLLTIKGAELIAVCGMVNEDRVFFCEDGAMLLLEDKRITAGNKVCPTKEEN